MADSNLVQEIRGRLISRTLAVVPQSPRRSRRATRAPLFLPKCVRGSLLLLSLCSGASFAASTWTGYITDTHCGTHCQRTSNMKPDLRCIQTCIRKGSKYGLWSGNRVYVLEPQQKAASFAAQNVEVTGTLRKGVIRLVSIRAVPAEDNH